MNENQILILIFGPIVIGCLVAGLIMQLIARPQYTPKRPQPPAKNKLNQ